LLLGFLFVEYTPRYTDCNFGKLLTLAGGERNLIDVIIGEWQVHRADDGHTGRSVSCQQQVRCGRCLVTKPPPPPPPATRRSAGSDTCYMSICQSDVSCTYIVLCVETIRLPRADWCGPLGGTNAHITTGIILTSMNLEIRQQQSWVQTIHTKYIITSYYDSRREFGIFARSVGVQVARPATKRFHTSDWRPLETCCRPWTWLCNNATALAGYANMMMMMNRYSTSAQLLHGCPAYTPPPSLVRYTNRPFVHQRRYTTRLTIVHLRRRPLRERTN